MQKQRVQQLLDSFPDDVNVDAFLERVYLLEKIEAGERQIEAGDTVSHEEAKQRLQKWLA
jgi:predicted transcriptional regulator